MTIHIDRGPFIYIPDKLHPGSYKMVKNPDWNGELPDIITFTDFLRWNYTLDYGRYIRDAFEYGVLPLPREAPRNAKIENVLIIAGYYDRIDRTSFDMYVICEVYFNVNGYCLCQEYVVYGRYESGGRSDFLRGIDMYDGKRIKLRNPLDDCLVPIMNKQKFRKTAKMIIKEYYPYDIDAPGWINVYALAKAMGLKIRYAYLSRNTKVKIRLKLIHDRRDTIVYNEYGKERKISITEPTILLDESISDTVEEYSAIVHECVRAYLHNLFYELQSLYRRIINVNIPEFNDYNFSKIGRYCIILWNHLKTGKTRN
ncbi:MAG TPA: hypothetical protein PLH98_08825 [Ruminococcus flavefaciens]|nr:hypothetical protein [Ruminococcus flavefaciens]